MTTRGGFGDVTALSESVIWELNRAWFEQEGTQAWSSGTVPSMITTNAVVGCAYARLVVSFLREWASKASPDQLEQPVHIVELGAGSGRLAYHLLQKLEPRLRAVPALRDLRITYVMTDFARSTIEDWRRHERLAPLVSEGRLDFAAFDAAWPAPLTLVQSGTVLDPSAPSAGPILVVANYVIDGLQLDAYVREGNVFEEHVVEVVAPGGLANVASMDDLALEWTRRPVGSQRYGDPELDRLLRTIGSTPGNRTVLFPVAFFQTLNFLQSLTTEPLLLISADKGWSRTPLVGWVDGPSMVAHGSISFMVDYSVIGDFVRQQGGLALLPRHQPSSLATAAFVVGGAGRDWADLAQSFEDLVADGGPDDWFQLRAQGVRTDGAVAELDILLAALRTAQYDSSMFIDVFRDLVIRSIYLSTDEWTDVHAAMRQVEQLYFPIGESADVPFCIALVLWRLRDFRGALRLAAWSARLHGPDPDLAVLMALCHRERGDLAEAARDATIALRLEPEHPLAEELLGQLELDSAGEPAAEERWRGDLWVAIQALGRPYIRRMPEE